MAEVDFGPGCLCVQNSCSSRLGPAACGLVHGLGLAGPILAVKIPRSVFPSLTLLSDGEDGCLMIFEPLKGRSRLCWGRGQ